MSGEAAVRNTAPVTFSVLKGLCLPNPLYFQFLTFKNLFYSRVHTFIMKDLFGQMVFILYLPELKC